MQVIATLGHVDDVLPVKRVVGHNKKLPIKGVKSMAYKMSQMYRKAMALSVTGRALHRRLTCALSDREATFREADLNQ